MLMGKEMRRWMWLNVALCSADYSYIALCTIYCIMHYSMSKEKGRRRRIRLRPLNGAAAYWTAFTMSKIGRYIATTMPPTITPSTTIIMGSSSDSSALTAASTSSS